MPKLQDVFILKTRGKKREFNSLTERLRKEKAREQALEDMKKLGKQTEYLS